MFTGFKALWHWMREYPWTAVILFLVLVPFVLRGLFVWISAREQSVPVVGPLLSKLGVTDSLAGTTSGS